MHIRQPFNAQLTTHTALSFPTYQPSTRPTAISCIQSSIPRSKSPANVTSIRSDASCYDLIHTVTPYTLERTATVCRTAQYCCTLYNVLVS